MGALTRNGLIREKDIDVGKNINVQNLPCLGKQ